MSIQPKSQVILLQLYPDQEPTAFICLGGNTDDEDRAVAKSLITGAWNDSAKEVRSMEVDIEDIMMVGVRVVEDNLEEVITQLTDEVTAFIQGKDTDGTFHWSIYDNHEVNQFYSILTRVPVGN